MLDFLGFEISPELHGIRVCAMQKHSFHRGAADVQRSHHTSSKNTMGPFRSIVLSACFCPHKPEVATIRGLPPSPKQIKCCLHDQMKLEQVEGCFP